MIIIQKQPTHQADKKISSTPPPQMVAYCAVYFQIKVLLLISAFRISYSCLFLFSDKVFFFFLSFSGCISSCQGVANGPYSSCTSCRQFVSCSNNLLFIFDCPANLFWDNDKKRCEFICNN